MQSLLLLPMELKADACQLKAIISICAERGLKCGKRSLPNGSRIMA